MKDEIYAQWLQYTQIITPFCKLYNHCWVLCQSKTLNTPIQRTLAQSTWQAYKQLYAILICQTADRPIVNSLHRNTHGDTMLPHSPHTCKRVNAHTHIWYWFQVHTPRKLPHAFTFSFSILAHTCKHRHQGCSSFHKIDSASYQPNTVPRHESASIQHLLHTVTVKINAEWSSLLIPLPLFLQNQREKERKKPNFSFTGITCANQRIRAEQVNLKVL